MTKLLEIDGVKVKDAKKPIKLIVTEDDCKRANRKKPESCAIARACSRVADEARVHLSRVYLKTKDGWTRYMTPQAARSEIIAFDKGGKFEPGEYWLGAVHPSETIAARKKAYQLYGRERNHKSKNPRRKPHVVTNVRTGPI